MDNLEIDELVVFGVTSGDEEERGIAAIDNLGICVAGQKVIVTVL